MMESPLGYGNMFPTPCIILKAGHGERGGRKKVMETLKKYKSMLLCLMSLFFMAGMCEEDPVVDDAVLVKKVVLDQTTVELKVGRTLTLDATVTPEDATNKSLVWSSSNENVATVEDGEVTAVAEGVAAITATAKDGSGKSASCVVTVLPNPNPDEVLVEKIVLNQTQAELEVGGVLQLTATVTPEDADDLSVNWTSSDENVVTVEDGEVTAVGAGSAIVKAIANDGGGALASCVVTVVGKSDDGGVAMSPLEAKNKLESVGIEFVNTIKAETHENIVEVMEYATEAFEDFYLDEAYMEEISALMEDNDREEEEMTTRGINPISALEGLTRTCLSIAQNGARLSNDLPMVASFIVKAGLTDFYGKFTPDYADEVWRWDSSVNDRIEASFTDGKGQLWVAVLKGSKETTQMHYSTNSTGVDNNNYIDGPDAGTSSNETWIYKTEFTIDVPEQIDFTIKCNGNAVVELKMNSSVAFEGNYDTYYEWTYDNYWYEYEWDENGGWYDWYNSELVGVSFTLEADYTNLNVDATLTVNGYEEKFKTDVTKSGVTANASVKIDGKSMLTANARVNADVDALISDVNDDNIKAGNIKDISMKFDILGQVQVDVECPVFKNLYDAIQYFDEAEGIEQNTYWLDQVNAAYSAKLRFDNTSTTQATFEAEVQEVEDDWELSTYHIFPVMVFAADDSRHAIGDYFTETAFADLIDVVEKLAEEFEDMYSKYFEEELDAVTPDYHEGYYE